MLSMNINITQYLLHQESMRHYGFRRLTEALLFQTCPSQYTSTSYTSHLRQDWRRKRSGRWSLIRPCTATTMPATETEPEAA